MYGQYKQKVKHPKPCSLTYNYLGALQDWWGTWHTDTTVPEAEGKKKKCGPQERHMDKHATCNHKHKPVTITYCESAHSTNLLLWCHKSLAFMTFYIDTLI